MVSIVTHQSLWALNFNSIKYIIILSNVLKISKVPTNKFEYDWTYLIKTRISHNEPYNKLVVYTELKSYSS